MTENQNIPTSQSGSSKPDQHVELMRQADALTAKAGINVRGGKKYLMVKDRINIMREGYGLDLGIETNLLAADDKMVRVLATIREGSNRIIGSGLAEELRGAGVNKASAVENCETSAIGRALASLGLHGGEYPTFDEIVANDRGEAIVDAPPSKVEASEIPLDSSEAVITEIIQTWKTWCDDQLAGFKDYQTLDDLKFWLETQKPTLEALKTHSTVLYKQISEAVSQRKKEIENA